MQLQCPTENRNESDRIELAHGAGSRSTHRLIEAIRHEYLGLTDPTHSTHDAATIFSDYAFTTDSYVVQPVFFPGGNIGDLAINGTINDLAMVGAMPEYLSLSLIIEEGFLRSDLAHILGRIGTLARKYGIQIVTGDTKVVGRGQADGIYINTSGIGRIQTQSPIAPTQIRIGDAIIVSGDLGRHALAIAMARNDLGFKSNIESDTAALHTSIQKLLSANIEIHCLRDLTRGGLGSCLHELSRAAQVRMVIQHSEVPVHRDVRAVSEVLGMDPIFMANEGRFVGFIGADQAQAAIEILRQHGHDAATIIGHVDDLEQVHVEILTDWGTRRILPWPESDPLPRIC